MAEPTLVLVTDFGTRDTYVGVMKGVMRQIAPHAPIVDLLHWIAPGDVLEGAYRLWQSVDYFPKGSIFVVVVDPGVGTERAPLALRWPTLLAVGPDNGVFSYLTRSEQPLEIVEVQNPDYMLGTMSGTFHGRDLFAPVAAHLSQGVRLGELGASRERIQLLPLPELEVRGCSVRGEVLLTDRFGNVVTSIGRLAREEDKLRLKPWLVQGPPHSFNAQRAAARLPSGASLPLAHSFGNVDPGEALSYIGSDGMLEIAVNRGHAADYFGLSRGDPILLECEA